MDDQQKETKKFSIYTDYLRSIDDQKMRLPVMSGKLKSNCPLGSLILKLLEIFILISYQCYKEQWPTSYDFFIDVIRIVVGT